MFRHLLKHSAARKINQPGAVRSPLAVSLEPRMMFDGAVAATVADTAASQPTDAPAAQDGPAADSGSQEGLAAAPTSGTLDQRQELVFVDGSVKDYQQLVAALKPGTEVVVLDGSKDGLQQIADYLDGRSGIDAIHVISHGSEGQVLLGTGVLDMGSLQEHADALSSIGEALSAEGDILLYGCDVAKGSGQALIQQIASLTAADVAASSDATGSLDKGGDWSLEAQVGSLETAALWQDAAPDYDSLLATVSLNQTWLNNGTDDWSFSDNQAAGNLDATTDSIFLFVDTNAFNTPPVEFTISSISGTAFNLDSIRVRPFNDANDFQFEIYPTNNYAAKVTSVLISNQPNQTIDINTGLLNITSFTIRFVDTGTFQGSPANMDFLSFTTSPANVAPTIANLGNQVAWAGVGGTVALDAGGDADLGDGDLEALNGGSGDWTGASLVIQRDSAAVGSDVFGFDTSGALFTVSGNELKTGATTFATFTNTGGVLTISFTGTSATTTLVNDVAQRITYRNDTPAGDANIRYTLNDGDGGSATANVTVASDTIYVTNTTDTATINAGNGVSFSEAIAIAQADGTGSQTIIIDGSLANQTVSTSSATSLGESLTLNLDSASGVTLSGGTLSLGGGVTLSVTNGSGDSATLASTLAGTGALTKAGAGNLTLSGSGNSYSGATSISAGTLTVSGGDAISGSSSVSVSAGATLALSGNESIGNLSGAGSINLGSSTLTTTQTADTTFSGGISGTGGLTVNQTGASTFALTLSGTNTYSGPTITSNFGWLKLDGDASLSGSGALRVNGNSVVTLLSDQTVGSLASNSTTARIQLGAFTLSAGGDNTSTTASGVISGTGSLVKQGSGTLTLGGTNTYTGTTTVSGGTLSIAGDGNLGSGTLSLGTGSTLDISGAGTIDNAIALNGDASITNANAVTLSGLVSGSAELLKGGAGNLTLSNTGNSAQGWGLNLTSGSVTIGAATHLGAGTLTLAGGSFNVDTASTVTLNQQVVVSGPVSVNYLTGSSILTFAGAMSGSGALALNAGGNSIYLNNASGLSGDLAIATASGGIVAAMTNGTFGSGQITLANNSRLGVAGEGRTFANDIVLLGNATLIAGASSGSGIQTLSGTISESGATGNLTLSAISTASLALSGSNSYSGTTTFSSGRVQVSSDANLGSGNLILGGGTLVATSATTLDNNLTVSSGSTVETAAALTLSGVISGSGALTKTGTSSLTLTGTETHTGTTTVSAGTLVVNGSTAGATLVSSGGTLAGTGTLGGNVSVQSGGTLAPGIAGVNNGVGTLTINGGLTLAAGSTLAVEINGTTAGTGHDQVVVNGAVSLGGATLDASHGYAPGQGDSYRIIDNDVADAVTGSFSGLAEGGTVAASGNGTVLTTSYLGGTGNDVTLTAPINAAPVVSNLDGDSVTFTQGSGAILLDFGTNATVTDGDSADFAGGNVTVSILANGVPGEDVLGIANQGTGAGQIGLSGSDVTYQGTVIGTWTGGSAGADLVISLNANATAAAVQALVRNLNYSNSNATNGIDQADRTLRVTLNDGDGGTSSSADITVSVVETVAPTTVSIQVDDTALAVGETTTVTITFSEAVTGLAIGDFTLANGTLSNLATGDGGITWTATLTPAAGVEDAGNLITLDNSGYTDLAGNAGSGTTDSNSYAVDTLRPTAGIVVADSALAAGETSTVTITFSEAVTGLDLGDFTVANGTLSNLATQDNIVWTATFTPSAGVESTTNLISLDNTGVTDVAGNAGSGSTSSGNYQIDTLRPTLVSIDVDDTVLSVGETATVTLVFSEAVTGLDAGDFTVQNGALSNFSSSDGGVTWTATLTPSAGVADPSNVLTLDNTGYLDAAGNTGSGTSDSANYQVDTEAPVNAVPGAQTTTTVTPLVFSSGNGNAITVSDGGSLTVVVSAASGTLTAATGGTAGISNNGSGSVTITGSAAEVNAALEGLVFTPSSAGAVSITVQTTDGAGNSDSDSVVVTVDNATLVVTSSLDTGADESTGASFAADQADGGGLSIREALHWARAGDSITFDLDAGALGNQGGAITLNGNQLSINYSNLTIDGDLNDDGVADVTLSANNASRVLQVNSGLSGVELSGLNLTQGSTSGGGAGLSIGFGSSLTLRDSSVTDSTESGLGGGGIYGSGVALTLINTTVSGNTSTSFGGGLRIVGNGTLNLLNSTVSGNSTNGAGAHGGGIQYAGTGLTIVNSTISGNAALGAGSEGGGLRITTGPAQIYNTTIVGNAASGTGGGVSANGTDTLVNTLVAGNTAGAGAAAGAAGSPLATGGSANDVSGTVETATHSYFGSSVTLTTNDGSLNNQGTGSLLLGNLAFNNGGTVQTHKPQVGSALLEAGSNADLPLDSFDLDGDGNTSEALPIDANGAGRVAGTVDIGAVEANAAPVLGNLDGGGSFTEGGPAVVIDGDASVSDADLDALDGGNGDYHGASVVLVRNGGADADDLFGFLDGNGISLVGGNLVKNGQVIGSFDTSVPGQLTLTFTHANGQTPGTADVNQILQQLTYANGSEDPGASVTLDWTFADGQGATSGGSTLVSLVAVNDAPTASASGGNATFTENGSAVDLSSGVSLGTVEAGQSITGLTFSVSGLIDGASEILSIDGTEIALVNGASGTTSVNGIGYSVSLVGGTATITLTSAGLATATAQGVVDGMTYRNGSEAPSEGTRTLTLTSVSDSGGTGNGGVDSATTAFAASVAVVAVNDAPVITAPGSIAVTEDLSQALTGISFSDVDAGSGSVIASFSVTGGTLSAFSGSGVTVAGSGSASLTLTGTVADINAFIAANGLSFTGGANANGNVTLSVGINDGGNTGSGGALSDNASVTLAVTAVNDAPVNSLPAGQHVAQDGSLVFNAGNGNLISIADVDAGAGNLQVSLTASNGLITLGSQSGLSFITGDGVADGVLVFTGSLADINAALDGLQFTPTAGFNGSASIQFSTSDLGNAGSGGAQLDSDTLAITVDPINPVITGIAVTNPDGAYKVGDVIDITLTFDQSVIVDTTGGVPALLLETGLVDRNAVYLSGSGSNSLTFRYIVQAGDVSADLDYQSSGALSLNGGSIRNASSSDAILTLPATAGADSIAGQHDIVIDGVAPGVTSVGVPVGVPYNAGDTLTFVVNASEVVLVNGTPRLALDIGGTTVFADYVAGSGTTTLVFQYSVQAGLNDADGIAVTGLVANGGSLQDATGNAMNLALNNVGNTSGVIVDTQAPTATILVADPSLSIGETSSVTITFSEAVSGLDLADFSVENGVLSNLSSTDGGITWTATLTPTAGIADTSNLITLTNAGVQDAAGNIGTGSTVSNLYAIDGVRPTATIQVADNALSAGETSSVTITFSEAVSGLDLADFSVENGVLSNLSSIDGGMTWTATLTPTAGIADTSNLITLNNAGVQDAAGNTGSGSTASNHYAIDTRAPTVTSVGVPVGVPYNAGDTLTFVVNASEAVLVNGTPRLALDIGGTTVFADYVAGSGTATLVFQYSVQAGLNDADGIAVTGLVANGGSLQDATGNAMNLALNNVGSTAGVVVDTTAPAPIAIITLDPSPTNAGSVRYTLTFSEDVSGVDLSDFSLVTTGNATGSLGSLVQVDGRTYQITITGVAGSGRLALALNGSGTGVSDMAGNGLVAGLVGQSYSLAQSDGDPEFRSNPPVVPPPEPNVPTESTLPSPPPPPFTSPLLPPPLFEVPTLGSGIPTLGSIFINNGALAPSFIAQVFASGDSGGGDGSGSGFLGFGGGDAGVFGTSSLSGLFNKEMPQESGEIQLQWRNSGGSGQGLQGIFGAPTLGQQLQEIRESEQRQVRDLAWALGQIPDNAPQA
ncbi:Ig-like domain-containing protein [Metapseudomonas furukawaii]